MQVVAIQSEKHGECGPSLRLSMAVVRRILRFLQQEVRICPDAYPAVQERVMLNNFVAGIESFQAKKDPEKYQKFFKGYSYFLKAGLHPVSAFDPKHQNRSDFITFMLPGSTLSPGGCD